MKQTHNKVFIIAEAGVNHNGDLEQAKEMVIQAKKAGVDAIKFQSFNTEELVLKSAPKADYQLKTNHQLKTNSQLKNSPPNETQYQMLKKLELSQDEQKQLYHYCLAQNIQFLSSPFDMDSCTFLIKTLGLKTIKLGSGELTNAQMLYYIASTGVDIILSTGMSSLKEIKTALSILAFAYTHTKNKKICTKNFKLAYQSKHGIKALKKHVSLLHCTTEYPCPVDEVNLNVIKALSKQFSLAIGYSDHTQAYHISLAAVSVGATIIEKHFTLDKNLPGPDHKASINTNELINMVKQIRDIEKAKGHSLKEISSSELKNRPIARKGIYAKGKIKKGDIITAKNIMLKRPETKLSAQAYWDIIGTKAKKNYKHEQVIKKS